MFWKACSILGHVGSSIRSSQTRRDRFSAWRWSSSHRALCMDTHTHKPFILFLSSYNLFVLIISYSAYMNTKCDMPRYVKNTHLRVFVDLLGVGAGRFEAGQHLQQVKQRSEVRLLEEQQHGDVLLLGRRQTGGRQLDAFPLPLPPRSSQRHKHHLGSNRQTWRSDDSPVLYISNHRTTTRRVFTQSVVRWTETIKNKCRSGLTKKNN